MDSPPSKSRTLPQQVRKMEQNDEQDDASQTTFKRDERQYASAMQPPSTYAPSQEASVARPASIEARNRQAMADSDEEANEELLNQIRVVVRVRPLLQGESVLAKRAVTNTSGQMEVECR